MNATHLRTENGISTLITWSAGRTEIETAMAMANNDHGTEVYGSRSTYAITYTNSRTVTVRPATAEEIAELTAQAAPEPEYRTLKGAQPGDTITLWRRGDRKAPIGDPITVTIAEIRGGWYVTSPSSDRQWFLGGTGSKYWVAAA